MSDINFAAINENFPVAGQDNDTQVFRDNFDTIKTNFQLAKNEIGDLQENVVRADRPNDFNGNLITNAKFIANTETIKFTSVVNSTDTIDYENGNYQIFVINPSTVSFDFLNFPDNNDTVGKITIEMYGNDSSSKTISFTLSNSGASSVKTNGFPSNPAAGQLPTITLNSSTQSVIFEIWRYNESTFFMKYIGTFA